MKKRVMDRVLKARRVKIERAQEQAQSLMAAAFAIPKISDAHAEYTKLSYQALAQNKPLDSPQITSALKAYRIALKEYGFNEDNFQYTPLCTICGDTGNDNGKLCKCVKDEYIAELKKECELDTRAAFSFDECNTQIIKSSNQKKAITQLYAKMREYAQKFPNITYRNLIFSGGIGTGKTCLASATARACVERGYSAKIMSAYEFNSTMLTCHTSPISERNALLHDVIYADVFVLDDLGTEPMLRNVTMEYLLLVLEERLNGRRCTIITTNLSSEQLLNRYGERIYSRLSDKRNSLFIELQGDDLRRKK